MCLATTKDRRQASGSAGPHASWSEASTGPGNHRSITAAGIRASLASAWSVRQAKPGNPRGHGSWCKRDRRVGGPAPRKERSKGGYGQSLVDERRLDELENDSWPRSASVTDAPHREPRTLSVLNSGHTARDATPSSTALGQRERSITRSCARCKTNPCKAQTLPDREPDRSAAWILDTSAVASAD